MDGSGNIHQERQHIPMQQNCDAGGKMGNRNTLKTKKRRLRNKEQQRDISEILLSIMRLVTVVKGLKEVLVFIKDIVM